MTAHLLGTALGIAVPPGAAIAAGQIVLASGGAILLPTGGPLVLSVEEGSLELTVTGSAALAFDQHGQFRDLQGRATLTTGEGAVQTTAMFNIWRAGDDTPVVILAVAIVDRAG